jgi:glycosyltransferase involved in cell wall biosynthesis
MNNIAYVGTYLPKQCGIATYTDYLIHGICKVEPKLNIRVIAEYGASVDKYNNVEVIPCWDRNSDYVDSIVSHAKNMDIVHIQHEYSIYGVDNRLFRVLNKLDNQQRIVTIHCIRPAQFSERGSIDENFAKEVAKLADKVILHLETQKAILLRLGIPAQKIYVIPHGTELSNEDKVISRRRLELPEDYKILLMFGFIKKHKCLHVILDALNELVINKSKKDIILFIAGGLIPNAPDKDKEYMEFCYNKIDEYKLHDRVICPNRFFPNDDVPYIFGSADIVLFPYYEEDRSASGSFHLALGAGKPVIASRIPKFEELKEVCDELLVLPYNSSGIASMILRLLEDDEFRIYVLNKIDKFRQRTSWEATAIKHINLYRQSCVAE